MYTKEQKSEKVIAKDLTLGEVVSAHPECVETMLSYGLHCVGCHVAYSETIEQGARAHGLSDEEIDKMLEELNEAVINKDVPKKDVEPPANDGLTITKKASDMIRSIFSEQRKEGYGLRITATASSCSGLEYEFDFEKEPDSGDKVIECSGIRIFLDQESFRLLKGASIDYVSSPTGEGFRIENPNAPQSCDRSDSCD